MARAKKKNEQPQDEVQAVDEQLEQAATAQESDLAITQDDVRLIEALLFAATSPVTVEQLAERFPEDRVSLIPDILNILQERYAAQGVNLVQREKRWALRTSADLANSLSIERDQPRKFTRAAMETMAVVAYHQPVTRAEIENIRGVATSPGALDALLEAGWIKPGKKREVPGRPVTWLTTQAFLDHFGLERLEDLPGMEELKAAGLLDKRPAIETIPTTSDLFDGADNSNEEDPQEVTDEDLIGKSSLDEELDSDDESFGDEDEDGDDFESDDEESEDGDLDDAEDSSDEDDDEEEYDEDDDEDSDEDDEDEDLDDEEDEE